MATPAHEPQGGSTTAVRFCMNPGSDITRTAEELASELEYRRQIATGETRRASCLCVQQQIEAERIADEQIVPCQRRSEPRSILATHMNTRVVVFLSSRICRSDLPRRGDNAKEQVPLPLSPLSSVLYILRFEIRRAFAARHAHAKRGPLCLPGAALHLSALYGDAIRRNFEEDLRPNVVTRYLATAIDGHSVAWVKGQFPCRPIAIRLYSINLVVETGKRHGKTTVYAGANER